ncbi:MAG TPA: methyl-accepting chemotaxis protein [Symbiobacteriaceae bacterium]|nr:methyl-accepting chemotaxis protein [Symbiobacteriaceae bacterium]
MRLRIGVKLAVGFVCMMLVAGVGLWWNYRTLNTLQHRYDGLLEETYPSALAAVNLHAEVMAQAQMVMAYAATRDSAAIEDVKISRQRSDTYLAQLKTIAANDADLASNVAAVEEQRNRFSRMVNALFVDGDGMNSEQLLLSAEQARSVGEAMGKAVDGLVTQLKEQVASERTAVAAQATTAARVLALIALVALGLSIGVIAMVQVLIARPIGRIAGELAMIADGAGDLTRRIHVNTRDELQLLADSFNRMQASLQNMVRDVIGSTQQIVERMREVEESTQSVAAAAEQVQSSMETVASGASDQVQNASNATSTMDELLGAIGQIAAGASQQAMQVHTTTQTVSSMVSSMQGVAKHATDVSHTASAAAETARHGAEIVDETLVSMRRIRDKVLNTADRIRELETHSRKIGEIMGVITDIADQTNLLALNAAIEAARAGEQGRGFAVVADEVRKLAERSAQSAKEIRSLIHDIQLGTREAVDAIDQGARDVESGATLAASAGISLQEILSAVERLTHGVHSISGSAQDVLNATQAVARAVEEVAAVSQENSAATEEMAAGANQVSNTIVTLQQVSMGNGAAVEQVSASMEEVNHSMANIAAGAKDLAGIAQQLGAAMNRFKVQ